MNRKAMPRAVVTVAVLGAALLAPVRADAALAPPGAAVPFTEYEAEHAATDGAGIGPAYAFTQLAAEASGRRAVTITFPPTTVRTLTLTFTANTGWPAAQASELEVYAH